MMQTRGYRVIEYCNAGSESTADEHVEMLSQEEFDSFFGSRKKTDFHGDEAYVGSPAHTLFEQKLIAELGSRLQPHDIICHPFGHAHQALMGLFPNNQHVETGIGYPTLMPTSFRIFESFGWMHYHQGKEDRNGANYEWVIPNYFDIDEWEPKYEVGNYIAFLGRICSVKGMDTVLEIARRSPYPVKIAGQGDPSPWAHPNIEYVGPLVGTERSDFLRNARCAIMPTQFTEPFGGSGVEAMLCGTPLIAVDYGAFTETIADGVTGFRCHSLEEWMDAIENCGSLDRQVVSEVARHKYSLEACAVKYDRVFSTLGNLYREGWYTCDKYPIKLSRFDRVLTELEGNDCFFVSVGAMDGVNHDSLFQYTNRNKHWAGMLVEPVQEYFEKLKANYDYRENLFFENVAVLPESGEKLIHRIPSGLIKDGEVPAWADGISTFHPESGAISTSNLLEKSVEEQVKGVTFEQLAVKNNISCIDVLQIDTEGCDLNVFQQIWDMGYRPKLVRIEVVHMSQAEYETFLELIKEEYNYDRDGDDLIAELKQGNSLSVELVTDEQIPAPGEISITEAKALKVAFFTYDEWAFGSIHNALCKELLPFDIQANLLDWNKNYSSENFQSFLDIYDVFVTTPGNAVSTLQNVYGVPSDRIIVVAHEVYDLEFGLAEGNDFDSFKKFAVINPDLATIAKKLGIERVPDLVRNGIHFDYFYQKVPASLTTIGYAGSMESFTFDGNTERKRGRLVAEVASSVGLPFKPALGYSHFAMPSYYKSVDCVLMSSTQEACGLPMLEAAAAGRLPMGTRVGYLAQHPQGGILLPTDERNYVEVASALVASFNRDPETFKQKCEEVQEYARYNYDWKYVITDWVSLLSNL